MPGRGSSLRRAERAASLVVVMLVAGLHVAYAQIPARPRPGVPAPPPQPQPGVPPGARDTVAKDDTIAKANFATPDTTMQRLMNTPGYSVRRYQGDVITFDALTRGLELTGRALVQGDSQVVKSDTIRYNGSGSTVRVGASAKGRNVFVSPGQAPIISTGAGTYDIASGRANVSGVKTSVPQSGETLYISGEKVAFVVPKDSGGSAPHSANDAIYYLRNGSITACDDSIPDYYFKAQEIKRTGTFVVARPAVLYIGDVPVLWLPFIFQDIRSGRHSGILAPNVGISDIVRNSPSYRRNVEGLGYYAALSDYFDGQVSLDWRSSAGETDFGDPGFMRYNGELHYRWLERYVAGNLAVSQTRQADLRNTAISWAHSQDFTRNSSLKTNVNYVTSTRLQRQTAINPYSVLGTIYSQANYTQKIGPATVSLGGTQRQYPGRSQLERTLPTLNFNTSPLDLAPWLSWTPSLTYSSSQVLNGDQPSSLGLLARRGLTPAGVDTIFADTVKQNSYTSTLQFGSPLQIFGYNLGNSFSINSKRNDFPEFDIVTDVESGVASQRIYASTYETTADWTPSFTLPPLARNNFNLTPSLYFSNVDGAPYWIRNNRTGGKWVHQSKRPAFGLSASPTMFGLFGGVGPFTRIRHSITPVFGYRYAPKADVSDDFLAATAKTRFGSGGPGTGYLGALAQNSLDFQLSTNIEAKTKAPSDSNPEAGEKLKLLSLNFTGLSYDFERARFTHSRIRGLTTQNFGYTVRSDLLPGIDIGVDYSLFEGSTLSDSAKFKPFRERVTASMSFSNTANPFVVFSRLFGTAAQTTMPGSERNQPAPDDRYAREIASQPVAGRAAHNASFLPTITKGWQASFTFTSARQRPLTGANVVAFDPASRCTQFNTPALRLAFDQCVERARLNPSPDLPIGSGLAGAPVYQVPNTTSLGSNLNFNITEKWAASWQTQYDFEQRNFASQIVSLQRDLHDWRAIFAFTQSPNGSFAFNFLVSLKAEPDLKFDYHKSTYRNEGF